MGELIYSRYLALETADQIFPKTCLKKQYFVEDIRLVCAVSNFPERSKMECKRGCCKRGSLLCYMDFHLCVSIFLLRHDAAYE